MHNYEHEIICPENKAIRHYLWNDYFHDSEVKDIAFETIKKQVIFTLKCCRDMDCAWDKLLGSRSERLAYIQDHVDEYQYHLIFKGVEYFVLERMPTANDYINGRFKQSAMLKKICSDTGKQLYHFRIQFDDGYSDIVFKYFLLRKAQGSVIYPKEKLSSVSLADNCNDSIRENTEKSRLGQNFEKFIAMQSLYQTSCAELLPITRENVRIGNDIDTRLYSAYLLGKLGDTSDLAELYNLFWSLDNLLSDSSICMCSSLLPKKNIQDAIEDIKYRHGNSSFT